MVVFLLLALKAFLHVDEAPISPFEPVKAEIVVEHEQDEIPELQLDYQKLSGSFFEVKQESNVKTRFLLYIPDQKEGLQVLPSLTIKTKNASIQTPITTYTVVHRAPEEGLELRASILGQEPFYPGERVKLVYTIYYKGEIQLTKEELPLFHLKGVKPIGDITVQEAQKGDFSLRRLTQEVEFLNPGELSIPRSFMEGVAKGKKLSSEVLPFALNVQPFPNASSQLAFTGAQGNVLIDAELLSPKEVSLGSPLVLEVSLIGGEGASTLPNLFCQPGFSGFFEPGDPFQLALGQRIKVTLIPKTTLAKEIPPIYFASFDSDRGVFVTNKSDPIPIRIKALQEKELPKKAPFVPKIFHCLQLPSPPSLLYSFVVLGIALLFRFFSKIMLFFVLSSFVHSGEEIRLALYENADLFAKAPYCVEAYEETLRLSNELGVKQPTLYISPFLRNLSGWLIILFSNLLTLAVWLRLSFMKPLALLLVGAISIGVYALYLTPLQGVVLKSSGDVRSGQIVSVLGIKEDAWLLIDNQGKVSYIPLETLRVIW